MSSQEMYLFLDLNGKLDQNVFEKEDLFFKVVNLHQKHPLVQIGNYVFQGTYEDFLGTKVFFIEGETFQPQENVFCKKTPIHLKYLCKTAKVLQLNWQTIPNTTLKTDTEKLFDIKFNENYSTILKKLEKGPLNIEDLAGAPLECETVEIAQDSIPTIEEKVPENIKVPNVEEEEEVVVEETEAETNLQTNEPVETLDKYSILKKLAKKPSKQNEFQKVYENDQNNFCNIDDAENFIVLQQLFLQSLSMEKLSLNGNENDFNQFVNVEKSIKDGIIAPTEIKALSEEQKGLLLDGKNFRNFSLPMKLTYLIEQLNEHKLTLRKMKQDELNVTDEFGRTPEDKYRLLKRLTKSIWYYVYSNINE